MKAYSVAMLMVLVLAGPATNGYGQGAPTPNPQNVHQPLPILKYDPPANFMRLSASNPDGSLEDYSSTEVNASIQVYQFRPFTGNIQVTWQQTLLRDWIDPRYRESNVAAQPVFKNVTMEGAQAVQIARFIENIAGLPRDHMRTLVVANGAAAIIDVSAATAYSWQRITPVVGTMFNSVSIVANGAAPAIPAAGPAASGAAKGSALSGIFMGYKPKFTVNLQGPVGSGTFPPAPFFYLLSPSGRVYRTFDILKVPKNPAQFDYATAARTDPGNSGQFVVQGNQLVMQFGAIHPETQKAAITSKDTFTIYGVTYSRQ